jgi:hypothetical protein
MYVNGNSYKSLEEKKIEPLIKPEFKAQKSSINYSWVALAFICLVIMSDNKQ